MTIRSKEDLTSDSFGINSNRIGNIKTPLSTCEMFFPCFSSILFAVFPLLFFLIPLLFCTSAEQDGSNAFGERSWNDRKRRGVEWKWLAMKVSAFLECVWLKKKKKSCDCTDLQNHLLHAWWRKWRNWNQKVIPIPYDVIGVFHESVPTCT